MRLPSFNDFSVGILRKAYSLPKGQVPDLRLILKTVKKHEGNKSACVEFWKHELFGGVPKRSIVKALVSNGLVEADDWKLTQAGISILEEKDAERALQAFAKQLLTKNSGQTVISAVRSLVDRGETVSKETLQEELESFGVEGLANATTDHTNHLNWLIEANIIDAKPSYAPNDELIKKLVGLSTSERVEYYSLPLAQQIFLKVLRRVVEANPSDEVPAKMIFDECLRDYKRLFKTSQLSKQVLKPLEQSGWMVLEGRSGKSSGGKSGTVKATKKLLDIPITALVPDFEAVIPADLRAKINTPRTEIQEMLRSTEDYDRGLGLELLALRMILDLGLNPRAFRLRSKKSAYAELDLVAEGAHLTFSRWNIQCKCVSKNVPLGDIAKEVGLAIYSRAHVVAVVTTSDFSREAIRYCQEISKSTHLQFLLVPGSVVEEYLNNGAKTLVEYTMRNANDIMTLKQDQPIDAEE